MSQNLGGGSSNIIFVRPAWNGGFFFDGGTWTSPKPGKLTSWLLEEMFVDLFMVDFPAMRKWWWKGKWRWAVYLTECCCTNCCTSWFDQKNQDVFFKKKCWDVKFWKVCWLCWQNPERGVVLLFFFRFRKSSSKGEYDLLHTFSIFWTYPPSQDASGKEMFSLRSPSPKKWYFSILVVTTIASCMDGDIPEVSSSMILPQGTPILLEHLIQHSLQVGDFSLRIRPPWRGLWLSAWLGARTSFFGSTQNWEWCFSRHHD